MKHSTLIFILLVLLTACAAPTPVPTATMTTSPTASPVPSVTFTATETPLPTWTPTPPPAEFNQLAPENMGCLKNDMCLGLEVKDKEVAYRAFVEAFANGYENKAWMKQMGFDNADELMAYLRTSTHVDLATGEERAYWIPLTAPNGATFKILQGNGRYGGGIFSDKNPAIVEEGGMWVDKFGLVVASREQMAANEAGVATWMEKALSFNGEKAMIKTGSINLEPFGVVIAPDSKVLTFVVISQGNPPDGFKYRTFAWYSKMVA